jgi:predicted lysophospholipase L1 biosynthesis ABC-type transport system permease subunit
VINESVARAFWPHADPIGRHLRVGLVADDQDREIIGVVTDQKLSPYDLAPERVIYTLRQQQPLHIVAPHGGDLRGMTFLVKAMPGQSAAVIPAIRQVMREIDPDKAFSDVRLLNDDIGMELSSARYMMTLLSVFAVTAMVLTAVGLYGLMAHIVSGRRREIGIRMALGATQGNVIGPMLRHALLLVGVGLALGVAAALSLSRFIADALWNITASDAPTYIVVAVVMATVSTLAAYGPMRRAVRVPPTVALRQE